MNKKQMLQMRLVIQGAKDYRERASKGKRTGNGGGGINV